MGQPEAGLQGDRMNLAGQLLDDRLIAEITVRTKVTSYRPPRR